MKILSLNPYIPHPLNSGGNLRSHHIVAALVDQHEVTFASQWRLGEDVRNWEFASRFADAPVLVPCDAPVSVAPGAGRLRSAAPRPWFGRPLSIVQHDFDPFWQALEKLPLDTYDVVQVRTFHLIPYALAIRRLHPDVGLVLDFDDIASVLKRRRITTARNMRWISRWRLQMYLDYCRIRLYENRVLKEFDSVWVCSDADAASVARWIGADKACCVPNGVDTGAYADISPSPDSKRLLFVADFRSPFNEDGALWFCAQVLPQIRRAVEDAELWLVGRDPPEAIVSLHCPQRGVHVTGSVPSVQPYLAQSAVSVVPLLGGGGTRLKILEAMAAGLPVVSTSVGAEGIDAMHEKTLLLADTPGAMAQACISLLESPHRRQQLGAAGRQFVRDKYDWSSIHERIRECYDGLRGRRQENCVASQAP